MIEARDLSLDYLAPDDESLVRTILERVRGLPGRLLSGSFENAQASLALLSNWQAPARALLGFLLALPPAPGSLFTGLDLPQGVEATSLRLRGLCQGLHQRRDAAQAQLLRLERRRALFKIAYQDLEAAVVCLAIHVVRMRQIDLLDPPQARRLAEDNEDIFLQLAEMLGMGALRRWSGNISLRVLNPEGYWERINRRLAKLDADHKAICEQAPELLKREMAVEGIPGGLEHHPNTAASIYRRLGRSETLEELALRARFDVQVDTIEDCYRMLRLVNRTWPTPGGRVSLRDHIAAPKFNGYRTLVVLTPYQAGETRGADLPRRAAEKLIEFRIHTREMHAINEFGVVESRYRRRVAAPGAWWEGRAARPDFSAAPTEALDSRRLYVFSPIGELFSLPGEARARDYAHRVHSDLGKGRGSFVINGQPASPEQSLAHGDLVEFKEEPRQLAITRDIAAGRSTLLKVFHAELQAYGGLVIPDSELFTFAAEVADRLYRIDPDTLLARLGAPHRTPHDRRVSPQKIVAQLITSRLAKLVCSAEVSLARPDGKPMPVHFAQLPHTHAGQPCRVIPGLPITGRVSSPDTAHARLTIYRRDCPLTPQSEELLPLAWDLDPRPGETLKLSIAATDHQGLLRQVLDAVYACSDQGVQLWDVQARVGRDRSASIALTMDVPDYRPVERIEGEMQRLKAARVIHDSHTSALSLLERLRGPDTRTLPNPYTPVATSDPRLFKGREAEVQQILNCVEQSRNLVVLYGINRVGKTSIFYYLRDHSAPARRFAPVYINLPDIKVNDEDAFWEKLAREIRQAFAPQGDARNRLRTFQVRQPGNGLDEFRGWLKGVTPALGSRRLLLLIDEFSWLDERWSHGPGITLAYRLKSLVESEPKLAWVLCCQETIYRLAMARSSAREFKIWPLLQAAAQVHLDYLDPAAAADLVRLPVGDALYYDDAAVERILSLSANHPFLLQHFLMHIVDRVDQGAIPTRRVSSADVEWVKEHLLLNGDDLFHNIAIGCEGPAYQALIALAQASQGREINIGLEQVLAFYSQQNPKARPQSLQHALGHLSDLGFVRILDQGTRYALRIPLLSLWLQRNAWREWQRGPGGSAD